MSEPRDEELARVYRAMRRDEPPAHLDEAILAASRRAVSARPQPVRTVRRWAAPVALAASVVIAVALGLNVSDERPDFIGSESVPAPLPRPYSPPAAPREAAPPVASAPAPRLEPAAPEPMKRERQAPRGDDSARASTDTAGARRDEAIAAAKPSSAPAAVPERAPDLAASGQGGPAQAMRRAPAAEEARSAAEAAPQPKVQAAPAPAAPPPAAAARNLQRDSVLPESTRRAPQEWIEAIRKLKAQGRNEDVARELAAFRRAHPDFRVPDDLTRP
jgi:hypothetical protein